MRYFPPLLALAIGAFGIGVTEFAPMGMLPAIATDLHVSIPTAGLLVSAYAMGVLIGAPLMTLTTAKVPRRTLLVALMGIFTAGNLLAALSDSYTTLLLARVLTSFNHGAFFGVGAVVAASVVAPAKRAGAVAGMFLGLTIATIGGVPLATWVGETIGWRTAFGGIAGLGALAMVSLRLALPDLPGAASGNMMAEVRVLGSPAVLKALGLTVLGSSAMFTVFTYIAPILRSETRASTAFVTGMLVLYGIGMTLGNIWGGRATDKAPDRTLIAALGLLTAILVVFAAIMQWPVPAAVAILVWGFASFAIVPPLQMRVMEAAGAAPNLASAMNIGAFNLGNAIGAALGGAVISQHLGFPAVALAGAAMAGSALLIVLFIGYRGRRAAAAAA
jgi:DHA1 family inner membrane transport protein